MLHVATPNTRSWGFISRIVARKYLTSSMNQREVVYSSQLSPHAPEWFSPPAGKLKRQRKKEGEIKSFLNGLEADGY